jgi:hypothetical protein
MIRLLALEPDVVFADNAFIGGSYGSLFANKRGLLLHKGIHHLGKLMLGDGNLFL